jgi:outer membrane protein assembly factor BamB
MNRHLALLILLAWLPAAGCDSGGKPVTCEFTDPATLAQSSWPKFRRDQQNTGAIDAVSFASNPMVRAIFTNPTGRAFVASPVLGNGAPGMESTDQRLYIGALDGTVYALDTDTLEQLPDSEFQFTAANSVLSTSLITTRAAAEAIFVGSADAQIHALTHTGKAQADFWPFFASGSVDASPTVNLSDGTVYAGSLNGGFFGVCPNGIQRFNFTATGSMSSSPAVTAEDMIVVGSGDRQLRGVGKDGFVIFSVTTAGSMANAPVVEIDRLRSPPQTLAIYAIDGIGSLLKINRNGQPQYVRRLPAPVSQSSPALAGNRLYVGDDAGNVHAIDTADGSIVWTFHAAAPVRTSPAVAIDGDKRVVIVAAQDGTLHFIEDAGDQVGATSSLSLGASTQSSPAIRRHADGSGSVYIGDDSGRVLWIQ